MDPTTWESHAATGLRQICFPSGEEQLKTAINTFVWMHLPGSRTLDEADEIACKIFELMRVELLEQKSSAKKDSA